MSESRTARRTLQGTVTSTKGAKTITVLVTRTFKHAKYGKIVRRNKKYHAHDEQELAGNGDLVEIVGTRPLSRLKRWRLVRVVEAAPDRGVEVSESSNVELEEAAESAEAGGAA